MSLTSDIAKNVIVSFFTILILAVIFGLIGFLIVKFIILRVDWSSMATKFIKKVLKLE